MCKSVREGDKIRIKGDRYIAYAYRLCLFWGKLSEWNTAYGTVVWMAWNSYPQGHSSDLPSTLDGPWVELH